VVARDSRVTDDLEKSLQRFHFTANGEKIVLALRELTASSVNDGDAADDGVASRETTRK
jgi:hypothetical protein